MSQILLFDLDGTLIDSRRDLALSVNLTRREVGLAELPEQTVASYIGDGLRKLLIRAFADAPDHPALEQLMEMDMRHYLNHLLDHTQLYPGVRETLQRLRQSYLLGVISNKPQTACLEILRRLGLEGWFSTVVGGGRTVQLKPSPQPVLLALKESGALPEGSWMIGDHRTDLGAAAATGLHSCFCTYGYGCQDGLPADAVIDRFPQLEDILL